MEFRQLEVFRVIAQELHFGRAAQRLFIAQASVTQQLQRLESSVGVRLVHRTSRHVQLTPAGAAFLVEAERLLAGSERAIEVARTVAGGRHGSLRIATNYPASRLLLLPLLDELRASEPDITTTLREMGSPDQLRALLSGMLDVGLIYGEPDDAALASRHLLDVPVVAIVRPGHPLAASDVLSLSDLDRYPYSAGYVGGSTVIEEALSRTAEAQGIRLARAVGLAEASGYLLELETTDTVGFSSLPRARQARSNGMHLLRIAPVEPTLPIHVAWDPGVDEPLVNTVVARLVELAKGIDGRA